MTETEKFHVVTVGWDCHTVESLFNAIEAKGACRFSHIVHPRHTADNWPQCSRQDGVFFFRDHLEQPLPEPDRKLLASLEQDGVPSVHNMIMGDRVVSKLDYEDALAYTTFLARRLRQLFAELRPSVVIVGFDSVHGSLGLAVARTMGIPVYATHFSVIPPGLAGFCDQMSPASRIDLGKLSAENDISLAEESLRRFASREVNAFAWMAPKPLSVFGKAARLPDRLVKAFTTLRNSRQREFVRFTEERNSYSVMSVLGFYYRAAMARRAIAKVPALDAPPTSPYVLFGLHMQPESSIDVWAPFFSNQLWVIELLSRSIPPTHKLLVKIHKSDVASYSRKQLNMMRALPGVELIAPFADTREFIAGADLVVAIQGTMGLEAALLGKPVLMLGDSPVTLLPSASGIGRLPDLPALIRQKLVEASPDRREIIEAYGRYLHPFYPASLNLWSRELSVEEIGGYVELFNALERYVASRSVAPAEDFLVEGEV